MYERCYDTGVAQVCYCNSDFCNDQMPGIDSGHVLQISFCLTLLPIFHFIS